MSIKNYESTDSRLPQDDDWESDFAVLEKIGIAFVGVDPEEIEREASAAVAAVRAEHRASGV